MRTFVYNLMTGFRLVEQILTGFVLCFCALCSVCVPRTRKSPRGLYYSNGAGCSRCCRPGCGCCEALKVPFFVLGRFPGLCCISCPGCVFILPLPVKSKFGGILRAVFRLCAVFISAGSISLVPFRWFRGSVSGSISAGSRCADRERVPAAPLIGTAAARRLPA